MKIQKPKNHRCYNAQHHLQNRILIPPSIRGSAEAVTPAELVALFRSILARFPLEGLGPASDVVRIWFRYAHRRIPTPFVLAVNPIHEPRTFCDSGLSGRNGKLSKSHERIGSFIAQRQSRENRIRKPALGRAHLPSL